MATVYLHIGTVKTGTTSIQGFLFNNREALKKYGYCFPEIDLGFGSYFEFRNGHFLTVYFENAARMSKVSDTWDRAFSIIEAKAREYENIILTDELIWHICESYPDFWPDLTERIRKINCELKVIVYLRRQDMLAESLWNQHIKSFYMETSDLQQWLDAHKYDRYQLDYYAHLMKIAKYVGRENVDVHVYEKSRFSSSRTMIIDDFLKAVGLTRTNEFVTDASGTNDGLRGNFLEFKRIVNGIPGYHEAGDFMRASFLSASNYAAALEPVSRTSNFSYESRCAFMEQFKECNRKVAVEFLQRTDGILFQDPIEELPMWKWNSERLERDVLLLMSEIFCSQEHKIVKQQEQINKLSRELKALQDQCRKHQDLILPQLRKVERDVESMYRSPIFRAYRKVRRLLKGSERGN